MIQLRAEDTCPKPASNIGVSATSPVRIEGRGLRTARAQMRVDEWVCPSGANSRGCLPPLPESNKAQHGSASAEHYVGAGEARTQEEALDVRICMH